MRGATQDDEGEERAPFVSIHAPVRGATWDAGCSTGPGLSFNPRARAGRDLGIDDTPCWAGRFQSTRPCGARLEIKSRPKKIKKVSIHAPVRGATHVASTSEPHRMGFQSTRPCGARRRRPRLRGRRERKFQSTRPCGARLSSACAYFEIKEGFNPRARAGRDVVDHDCAVEGRGSFNPRARAGRDEPWMMFLNDNKEFQSTRPCGARRLQGVGPLCEGSVSIHAPVRGATGSCFWTS